VTHEPRVGNASGFFVFGGIAVPNTAKMATAESEWLVQTLVHVAWVDGRIAPTEVALIERVMRAADWDDACVKAVRRMMDGRDKRPELAPPPATLGYEGKVRVFQDVVDLVFADHHLDKVEQDVVMKVANQLGLHLSDMQTIWSRARRQHEQR